MTTLTPHIDQYVQTRFKKGEISVRSRRQLRYTLAQFDRSFGDRPLSQLGRRAIERWLEQIGHMAPATRRNQVSAVKGFCRWLHRRNLIVTDPTIDIGRVRQPRSVPRALRPEDVGKLLVSLPDQRARAIIALMVGCGLRCVEVSRLAVGDYDPHAQTVAITGKGGHQRVLPVPRFVRLELDRYLDQTGVVAGPLIRDTYGHKGLSYLTVSMYVSRWMRDAGVKHHPGDGRSAHALRHTAASDVLDRSGDLRIVQEMLGHRHLATTSVYLRRAQLGKMREAMEGREYEHPQVGYDSGSGPPLAQAA